jgi:uncharacterized protein YbbK (DUF523 family)
MTGIFYKFLSSPCICCTVLRYNRLHDFSHCERKVIPRKVKKWVQLCPFDGSGLPLVTGMARDTLHFLLLI